MQSVVGINGGVAATGCTKIQNVAGNARSVRNAPAQMGSR
jgi:hypothetical protein